jgi:N-acyl-D-amino-acid deacylase
VAAIDLVIRNGRVVDGTGAPWFRGDVAISGDRIEFIGSFQGTADREINAGGQIVCPGFIDVHSHSDLRALAEPDHMAKVHQGITTDLIGLDGIGYAPLSPENIEKIHVYWAGLSGNLGREWSWSNIDEFLSEFDRNTTARACCRFIRTGRRCAVHRS